MTNLGLCKSCLFSNETNSAILMCHVAIMFEPHVFCKRNGTETQGNSEAYTCGTSSSQAIKVFMERLSIF